jgi:hypothetical protein
MKFQLFTIVILTIIVGVWYSKDGVKKRLLEDPEVDSKLVNRFSPFMGLLGMLDICLMIWFLLSMIFEK